MAEMQFLYRDDQRRRWFYAPHGIFARPGLYCFDKDKSTHIDDMLALDKESADRTPDNNEVICPRCTHQFRAVPVNEQEKLRTFDAVADLLQFIKGSDSEADAIAVARYFAKRNPPVYYEEPFFPHQWVIEAIVHVAMEGTRRLEGLQARIDQLMLEYCPDEITPEQRLNWARHQVPVSEATQTEVDQLLSRDTGG